MKITQIITENFVWDSGHDEDMSRSLNSLIKSNGGLWKSPKQASFILKKLATPVDVDKVELKKKYMGVDIQSGSHYIEISGMSIWANYGSRSQIPKWWIFTLDDFGVVQKFSIGARGNMRDGAGPNTEKVKLEWERDDSLITPEMEKEVNDQHKKEFYVNLGGVVGGAHIGEVGKRMHIGKVKLIAEKEVGATYAGYYAATRYWHLLEDENGNKFYYTGAHAPLKKGESKDLTAGIKQHMVSNKGEKVTVIWRPKWRDI
jgi:hypothetical protein